MSKKNKKIVSDIDGIVIDGLPNISADELDMKWSHIGESAANVVSDVEAQIVIVTQLQSISTDEVKEEFGGLINSYNGLKEKIMNFLTNNTLPDGDVDQDNDDDMMKFFKLSQEVTDIQEELVTMTSYVYVDLIPKISNSEEVIDMLNSLVEDIEDGTNG